MNHLSIRNQLRGRASGTWETTPIGVRIDAPISARGVELTKTFLVPQARRGSARGRRQNVHWISSKARMPRQRRAGMRDHLLRWPTYGRLRIIRGMLIYLDELPASAVELLLRLSPKRRSEAHVTSSSLRLCAAKRGHVA